ncbi:MAG TPA: helix-turn-helix domain-containing protein [Nitrososphaeraceae archaeon]|nr:helix-turn-helix domain-containing protein [Nitrososphaeraceae archaeon]
MRDTYLREVTDNEKDNLYWLLDDRESGYRAKIILLKYEGYTVPGIRQMTNHHDNNIRKWIHRFNKHSIDGIISKKHNHSAQKVTDEIEKQIVRITSSSPRKYGLRFSTWSLRVLAGHLMEKKIVDSISHSEIRNVLIKHSIKWRRSKTILGSNRSKDPEYDLKKSVLKI